ncbi:MAG TPA: endonuclease domain-containing protein [Polyangia bacterium]|nr:endonuclease domain-containing protein [Polyangia bacterium]
MGSSLFRRRALRRDSTDAERALWSQLRAKRFMSLKFRRQHPFGPYILDFYCPSRRLAIELDGGQHFEPVTAAYDRHRTRFLELNGITVMRFTNDLVLRELRTVLEALWLALAKTPPWPSPRKRGGYPIPPRESGEG